MTVGHINKHRNRPSDFITSRAKGRVSRYSQFEGISTEQRLNSLIRKGTSKERALWAIHSTWPPGIWWLLTYWSRIGINSFILHVNRIFVSKQILSTADNTIKWRKANSWGLVIRFDHSLVITAAAVSWTLFNDLVYPRYQKTSIQNEKLKLLSISCSKICLI